MRKFTLMSILFLGIGNMASCMAGNTVTEERHVEDFSSIDMDGVASVCFTQASSYTFRIEGEESWIKATSSEVRDGTLVITQKRKKGKSGKGIAIYISAPRLEKVSFDGVGSFRCKGRLEADDMDFDVNAVGSLEVDDLHCHILRLDFNGVGNADLNVDCDMLEAEIDGVGNVTLSGRAGTCKIGKSGIGKCNTRQLEITE